MGRGDKNIKRRKGKRCKCMTGVNGSVTGIALGDI